MRCYGLNSEFTCTILGIENFQFRPWGDYGRVSFTFRSDDY